VKQTFIEILEAIAMVGACVLLLFLVLGGIAFFFNVVFRNYITPFQILSFVWCFIGAVGITVYLKKK